MLPLGANLQKIKNGQRTYAITPHLPGGFVTPERLELYAHIARKYSGVLKITSAQRIMITNLKAEEDVYKRQSFGCLGEVSGGT